MRASLGFRAGPLYLGTGNLLRSRRRRRRTGLPDLVLVYPLIGMWLLLKYAVLLTYWWIPLYAWRVGRWAVRRIAAERERRVALAQSTLDRMPDR